MTCDTTTFDDIKDPDARLDYQWDWSDWLAPGEVINTATWNVQDGITQDDDTKTDSTATIWLTGGTIGEAYEITCHITTNQERIDDRTTWIRVEDR